MKKLILSFFMIMMLTGCKAEPTPVPQNVSDNTVNTGIACSDGEKTFLSFTDGLYIVEEDTDKLIMLTDEDSSVKFTDNDWVYYTNYTENTFCRIKKDGTEKETLHNEVCSTAVLYNNRIYFQEKSDGKTFSMNTDGTDKKDVTDWYYSDFILADDDMYYIGFDNTVDRCKLGDIDDAYNYDVIYNGRCESLNYYDGKLFFFENPAYFDENYGGDIVCTDLNGKSKQKISGGFYDKVKVYDGKIYFRKGEEIFEEETLCSMDLNGENVKELADNVHDYNVVDDRIYIVYKDSSVGRIKTDGTEMTFEAEITSEIVDTSKLETKELSEKELLSEYIEYYKEYFKDNYSENPTEEVSVFFCDFDDDGKYEASLRYPELWIKNYNEATKTVEEMREWEHISGANKYRLASGEEIYIYQPDNQFLFYSQFENGRYVGGEYLLGNAYFDDRVKKEVTYFYFVGDIAAEGLDAPIEYVNSRIEHEPIKDNLVTKETYEKVIKEFYEKTEPVPVCIKTLSMTVDEWLTLSTEEILEKTEDDVLASELPEHKIDEGEDYEN